MKHHRTQRIGLAAGAQRPSGSSNRLAGAVLTLVIVELTLATAYVHINLGGLLFTLNGLGYLGLAAAYVATAAVPALRRFGWLPKIGLAGYAAITIGAYLAMGPYFSLGWVAKGIEFAVVGLVAVDLLSAYGDPGGLWRGATGSLRLSRVREH
jgi:hypothetical protein